VVTLPLRDAPVTGTPDGPRAEAAEPAQALRPDVVFCDLGLPDIDGRDVAARLRQDPAQRRVRLVALTGWGNLKDRQLCSRAGFDAHLTKPASTDDIGRVLAMQR
jgi:CheY-like chemotaxis protein